MSSLSKIVCFLIAAAARTVAASDLIAAENAADRQPLAVETTTPRRELTALSDVAKSALRASHAAKSTKERDIAARQLVEVFVELQSDQSLATGTRHNLQQQIRHRLLAIETGLRSAISSADARRKAAAASTDKTNSDITAKAQSTISQPAVPQSIAIDDRPQVLAQQVAPPAAPAAPPPRVNNQPNASQPADDYGPELLDLIQRVIRPSSWDINGGASSGYYFQPLHALVISAPAEMHGEIGGVLGGLRK